MKELRHNQVFQYIQNKPEGLFLLSRDIPVL